MSDRQIDISKKQTAGAEHTNDREKGLEIDPWARDNTWKNATPYQFALAVQDCAVSLGSSIDKNNDGLFQESELDNWLAQHSGKKTTKCTEPITYLKSHLPSFGLIGDDKNDPAVDRLSSRLHTFPSDVRDGDIKIDRK